LSLTPAFDVAHSPTGGVATQADRWQFEGAPLRVRIAGQFPAE
jgi:hypothetical protein